MKICAIICEYNPLHSGHKYQIEKARSSSGADAILCIMSGNFVQRAEPAIFDKYTRTRAALECGANLVIELPTIFSIANAQKFASGAVQILSKFDDIEYLAMGCEDENEKLFNQIADVQIEENESFKKHLSLSLANGASYARAYTNATNYVIENDTKSGTMSDIVLSKPNNLLCIEYIKALKRLNSKIKPLPIKRIGNGYNNISSSGNYISATAARELLVKNDTFTLTPYIPPAVLPGYILEQTTHKVNMEIYDTLIINALRNEALENIYDVREGLENKLKDNALKFTSLEKIYENTKSKRYTMGRIKRIALNSLLGITKELMENSQNATARLLGIDDNLRGLIDKFPPCITIQNSDIDNLTGFSKSIADIDKKASNIYSLLTKKDDNQYFSNKLIISSK